MFIEESNLKYKLYRFNLFIRYLSQNKITSILLGSEVFTMVIFSRIAVTAYTALLIDNTLLYAKALHI